MPSNLIVIYGPPLSGKSTLAWALGRSMPAKTAIVSADQLLEGALPVPGEDADAELDMVHVQLRLLVANYMKNRYHAIVEGPFIYERDGAFFNFESDIDQLIALMRQMTDRAIVVRLQSSEDVRATRAAAAGRESELATAQRVESAYKDRFGVRFHTFDTGAMTTEEVVGEVQAALNASTD